MEAREYKTIEKIAFDGEVHFATCNSRTDRKLNNRSSAWSDLVKRLSNSTRTAETIAEYEAMPKAQRDQIKDVGGFVGGLLKDGRRTSGSVAWRSLLTLDLDNVSSDPWASIESNLCCAAVLYSTHSHKPEAPRYRIILPLSRRVTPDEYVALARRVAADIGIDMCDDSTYEVGRLMYWPSTSEDGVFRFEFFDAPWLDPDDQLARYHDWTDSLEWPRSSREERTISRLAKKQGDPLEKTGIVGAFCKAFTIKAAIEEFLPDVYTEISENRYTFAAGSTAGGLIVYDDKFAYSHHGSDPAGGKLCNAFDLVRIHLFCEQDIDIDPLTPVVKRPSYISMCEYAMRYDAVKSQLVSFDDPNDAWTNQLEFTKTGDIKSTIDNLVIILKHDALLSDKYAFDSFRERPVVLGDLPWQSLSSRSTDTWSDSDDAGLRWYIEKKYRVDSARKLKDAIDTAMQSKIVHPVREYLESLTWDGMQRLDSLLNTYFYTDDSAYTRTVTRKAFIGSVARIFDPGCKHDHMLVLIGPQGCGKSTFLAKFGGKWYSDSVFTLSGKTAYEQLQGYWIIELGEMAATRRAEIEQIKQFVSKQSDVYRAAYGTRTSEHPRQCSFFGTTNDNEFMRDPTGGRRFWPVVVNGQRGDLIKDLKTKIVNQVWAEAVAAYRSGENWYLDKALEEEAHKRQMDHTEISGKQGMIQQFLVKPILADWDSKNLDERRIFWADPKAENLVERTKVCAIEIWVELFNGDPKQFTPLCAREINDVLRVTEGWEAKSKIYMGPIYGYQRGFTHET